MRQYVKLITGLLSILTFASCGNRGAESVVPVYDLAAAVNTPRMEKLKVGDVRLTALDTVSKALLSNRARIIDVLGDTIVIEETDKQYKVLLFSLSDGKLLREINHIGQGPGEYAWLDNVYVDRDAHEVVLTTPVPIAHRYTLSDSLVKTYNHGIPIRRKLTKGSLEKGINFCDETENGFIIRQANKDFIQTDSIVVDGYKLGYMSGDLINYGDEGAITMVDTLYILKPGRLEKTAVLNRGGKTITPEIEKELSEMKSFEDMIAKQHEYIETLGLFITDGNLVMIAYMYGKNETEFFDFFRRDDGELLTHIPMKWDEDRDSTGMAVEYEGSTLYVKPLFARDGRWYAILPETQVPGAEDENNGAIVSFTLTE